HFARKQRTLDGGSQFVCLLLPAGKGPHEGKRISRIDAIGDAVAMHHIVIRAFYTYRQPQCRADVVPRDGYFFHGGAQILQTLGRLAYRSVDAFFRLWPSKAFLHDAYPQTFYSLAKDLCVRLGAHPLVSAIAAVLAGNDLEPQRAFVHGIGHEAYEVEGIQDA